MRRVRRGGLGCGAVELCVPTIRIHPEGAAACQGVRSSGGGDCAGMAVAVLVEGAREHGGDLVALSGARDLRAGGGWRLAQGAAGASSFQVGSSEQDVVHAGGGGA